MDDTNGADVDLKIAGQEVRLKNVKSLNTIATVTTLIMVSVLSYAYYVHAEDTKMHANTFLQSMREHTSAVREQTIAQREQNCLMRFDLKDRLERADFCKQVAR